MRIKSVKISALAALSTCMAIILYSVLDFTSYSMIEDMSMDKPNIHLKHNHFRSLYSKGQSNYNTGNVSRVNNWKNINSEKSKKRTSSRRIVEFSKPVPYHMNRDNVEQTMSIQDEYGWKWRRPSLTRPGEMGRPVIIDRDQLSKEGRILWDVGFKKNSYNQFVSDLISVNRSLPDYRSPECQKIKYENLPQVSVVIPFINESFSVLMRTVHSVLNRSPPDLLKEIVLGDDASSMDHLGKPLEDYIANFPKVSIRRLKRRQGLVQARMLGFNHSTAPVVIFLDSHIEVTLGWLEPLLDRIKLDYRTVVSGVIDDIDATDFRYNYRSKFSTSIFTWDMIHEWLDVRSRSPTAPVRTATLPGCFIGISRRFFTEIGMFDWGLVLWGAENMELSFKVWMCHGKIEIVPCSHIGHVFRDGILPYELPIENYMTLNALRLAEVWTDDYKEFVYQQYGRDFVKTVNIGDISSRKRIRDKLKCKSFQWYLSEIAKEVFIPTSCSGAWGRIESVRYENVCATLGDTHADYLDVELFADKCSRGMEGQLWYLCDEGIRRQTGCWTPITVNGQHLVSLDLCRNSTDEWVYTDDNKIYNTILDKCLEISHNAEDISLEPCSDTRRQQWKWRRGRPPGPMPKY